MKHFKKKLGLIAKLLLVVLLLGFLTKKGLLSLSELHKIFDHPTLLALVILGTTINTVIGISRWQILLKAQGIQLDWLKTARLNLIGGFFNLALPGAVSGDLVKAFYIAREFPGKRGHVFGSILFDRIVGVAGLVIVATVAMVMGYGPLHEHHVFQAVQGFVLLAFSGMVAFFGLIFFVPDSLDPVTRILRRASSRVRQAGSLLRIYEGVRNYHSHRSMVASSLALSCVIHAVAASSCMIFFRVLDGAAIDPWGIFVVVPLGLLVTAVPVAPAGVGTGHAAFSWLFLLLGSSAGANIFSLLVVFQLFVGAIGGWVYLRYRAEIPNQLEAQDSL